MEKLYIKGTDSTPEIHFDITQNYFLVKGKSVFSEVDEFYSPIINWLKNAEGKFPKKSVFVFDLEYFNIISSKRILFILYTLNELRAKGDDIHVTWSFSLEDDDMKEVGEDYAYMVNLPFNFVCKTIESEIQ
ncbi:MAG: DUF1987 domain-containing protein [Flavobacteriales bacterium]|jgi:hypothetical protein|nr:hypothetical protein [Flavobacteriales bacterium]MBX2958647.1 DUF1987 domain-containing protein [Flavobacteriales bacterium]